MKKLLSVCLAVSALGMGCGSDDKDASSDACAVDLDGDDLKVTAINKRSSSDASCPVLTPDDLNEADDEDAGADDECDPVVNEAQCSLTVDCTDEEGTKLTGSFAADGDELKGMLTIKASAAQGGVSCSYDITWK